MKLTKTQLKQIIKEELEFSKALGEGHPLDIPGATVVGRPPIGDSGEAKRIIRGWAETAADEQFWPIGAADELEKEFYTLWKDNKLGPMDSEEKAKAAFDDFIATYVTDPNHPEPTSTVTEKLKQIIKEEIEDALAETRWGTSKPSVPKKRWCVKYKVGGEDKYKEVSADTDPLARAAAKKSARDDGGTVLDGDIESTRELDSGQKCGA